MKHIICSNKFRFFDTMAGISVYAVHDYFYHRVPTITSTKNMNSIGILLCKH